MNFDCLMEDLQLVAQNVDEGTSHLHVRGNCGWSYSLGTRRSHNRIATNLSTLADGSHSRVLPIMLRRLNEKKQHFKRIEVIRPVSRKGRA